MRAAERHTDWSLVYRLASLAAFLAIWFLVSRNAGPLLPSPSQVAVFLWREWSASARRWREVRQQRSSRATQ